MACRFDSCPLRLRSLEHALGGQSPRNIMKSKKVLVNDLMQKGYVYELSEPMGKNFAADFKPELTPKQMLELGVFGGKYMTDCGEEFPADWFKKAKLCSENMILRRMIVDEYNFLLDK